MLSHIHQNIRQHFQQSLSLRGVASHCCLALSLRIPSPFSSWRVPILFVLFSFWNRLSYTPRPTLDTNNTMTDHNNQSSDAGKQDVDMDSANQVASNYGCGQIPGIAIPQQGSRAQGDWPTVQRSQWYSPVSDFDG